MSLDFEGLYYTVEDLELPQGTMRIRAFYNIPYVASPVSPQEQQLCIYAPEEYFVPSAAEGTGLISVLERGYNYDTAPIFMPVANGGYRPGRIIHPGASFRTPFSASALALGMGMVVVSAGCRGNGSAVTDPWSGNEVGVGYAPACVVDFKAAIRWLRHNTSRIPGNPERIITNGCSAGGATSALLGVTGDDPDYLPYLQELGAAKTSDRVYASSCYCPVTNLDNADILYEWEYCKAPGWQQRFGEEDLRAGAAEQAAWQASQVSGYLAAEDLPDESVLTALMEDAVLRSAQQGWEDCGHDIERFGIHPWIDFSNGKVAAVDLAGCIANRSRRKGIPAFDDDYCLSPENQLFGCDEYGPRHYTLRGLLRSQVFPPNPCYLCPEQVAHTMNPMFYLLHRHAGTAQHMRIRHGLLDSETCMAISALLTLAARQQGIDVDFAYSWGMGHGGDYDLGELVAWLEGILTSN